MSSPVEYYIDYNNKGSVDKDEVVFNEGIKKVKSTPFSFLPVTPVRSYATPIYVTSRDDEDADHLVKKRKLLPVPSAVSDIRNHFSPVASNKKI